jgi:hypothetical protein
LSLVENELENNVTHAFLFAFSKSYKLRKKILHKINTNNYGFFCKNSKFWDFNFQVSKSLKKCVSNRSSFLLFIRSKYNRSILKYKTMKGSKKESKKNIPDALLFNKKYALLIESKVSSSKDKHQIRRYNKAYLDKDNNDCISLFWEDIYLFTKEIYLEFKRNKNHENLEFFIITQFKNYLELINLDGFSGIPFFDINQSYDKDKANSIIKKLEVDLSEQNWYKSKKFKTKSRPKNGAWYSIVSNKFLATKSLTSIPHNSIYLFDTFFGVGCLFHKRELGYMLKKYDVFFNIINKLSTDPDYYFRAAHYKPILNKYKARSRNSKVSYTDFEFCLQLSRFKENCKSKDKFKKRFKKYLKLLSKEDMKQYSIIKKTHYGDPDYFINYKKSIKFNLTTKDGCLKFIKKTFCDLEELINFIDDSKTTKSDKSNKSNTKK